MGIDYSGGMIVGAYGIEIDEPEEFDGDIYEWAIGEHGMDQMSLYYDASIEQSYIGYRVDNVDVEKINGEWLKDVKVKAEKFFKLTGVKARLIGTQDIT